MEPFDLEVIPPDDAEVPPRRPRRRWPWLLLAGVALGACAAYALAARAAVRDLDQHWLAACDVGARAQTAIIDASRPGAESLLPEEREALQQRANAIQQRALAGIRAQARHVHAVDPGVRRLRDAVVRAVNLPDVYVCAPPVSRTPPPVDVALTEQLHRWHLSRASRVSRPVALPPITVTTLPVATEPTATTLLIAGTSSQYVVDVDANTTRAVPGTARAFVSGRGWWLRFRNADAFLERLDAPPIALAEGGAQYATPAASNDAVWLVTASVDTGVVAAHRFATRDGSPSGTSIALPETTELLGEVPEGLLLFHQTTGELDVWDAESATTIRVFETWIVGTEPVSARGSLLAWAGCQANRCGVHLTDTATGDDRFVTLDAVPASLAVSPDGRTVAAAVDSPRRNLGDIVLVDVATTATRVVWASWIDRPDLAWGRAGDRLFIVSGLQRSIWMYRIDGSDREEELHVRVPEMINALAVL